MKTGVVAHEHGRAVIRQLGEIASHVVVERELPLQNEQRRARRGELLGDRADVVHHRRPIRNVVIQVGNAVATLVEHAAVLNGAHRAARRLRLVPRREDAVDRRIRRILCRCQLRCEQRKHCTDSHSAQRAQADKRIDSHARKLSVSRTEDMLRANHFARQPVVVLGAAKDLLLQAQPVRPLHEKHVARTRAE